MEFVWADIQCGHLGVCDFDTGWVSAIVDLGVESGARCGGGDQLYDGLVTVSATAATAAMNRLRIRPYSLAELVVHR